MCCRFYIKENDPDFAPIVNGAETSGLYPRIQKAHPAPLVRAGEVRPMDVAAVLAMDKQQKLTLFPMIWGFSNPKAGQPLVNCRVETVATKPTWRESWERHRCIVPASWYYEWEHFVSPDGRTKTGNKYMIQPRGSRITYLAGLYRIEETAGLKYPVFAILTREPSEEIRFIHERMPLILPKEAVTSWIRPEGNPNELIQTAIQDMVYEKVS